jgi:hypothetical protein
MGGSPALSVSESHAISSHPCYQHYVRIPDRICSSLDFFDHSYDREIVPGILKSFYLFIGIVDHAMDTISISIASDVLQQLKQPASFIETVPHKLATELLKSQINPKVYDIVLHRFSQLCEAVFHERCSRTISEYAQQRRNIGSLTAEISYLLIMPFLNEHHSEVRDFFGKVGEVGCLVDSLIDLRSDYKRDLINFRANVFCYLKLLIHAARIGIPLILRYPNLISNFCEAIIDNCCDTERH